tara:strand:+ start:57 stop:983 length:927 start_codon:yes stop_codon:yes gene_type:complete
LKILISGYGSHAKRRIIPALLKSKKVKDIHIISRNRENEKDNLNIKFVDLDLKDNKQTNYDYVIISSPPYAHKGNLLTLKSISNNFIIEKPIFTDLEDLKDEDFISKFKSKNIIEGLMYLYHPLWREVKNIFDNELVIEFTSSFTIPHIEKNNYRYYKDKGGGFTLDLGVYPVSLFFNLIEEEFDIFKSEMDYKENYEVDLGGNLEILTKNKILYKARWGVGFEYSNFLEIKTNKATYNFPSIFTKGEEYESFYIKKTKTDETKIDIGNYDQFQLMYEYFFSNNINQLGEDSSLMKTYELIFKILIRN